MTIQKAASLIGGKPEELKTALEALINSDIPVAPCVDPRALAYAHNLLEHYAACRASLKLSYHMRKGSYLRIDEICCENVLKVAQYLLLMAALATEPSFLTKILQTC